jgi:REP element-mobilizing transposase RayT
MSRPLRVEFAGACYHVINRGNYRRDLFKSRGAAEAFERTLGEAAGRFGLQVHAYVVMRNHFHLAVEIAEPNALLTSPVRKYRTPGSAKGPSGKRRFYLNA